MRCEKIMKTEVACVTADDLVQRAAWIMRGENIGFLPVCNRDGGVIGTITDRDIAIRVCAEGLDASETRIGDVMTDEVVACYPEDDITRVEQLMAKHQKSRIVVTNEVGRLLGVISLSDIVGNDSNRHAARTLRKIVDREQWF
jgi:CBS domain-containing protein